MRNFWTGFLLLLIIFHGLVLYQGDGKAKLHFTTNSSFLFVENPNVEFEFTKDSHNKVNGFTQKKGGEIVTISKVE